MCFAYDDCIQIKLSQVDLLPEKYINFSTFPSWRKDYFQQKHCLITTIYFVTFILHLWSWIYLGSYLVSRVNPTEIKCEWIDLVYNSILKQRPNPKRILRVHLHQLSASMLRQLCNDDSDSVLIDNNSVSWKWCKWTLKYETVNECKLLRCEYTKVSESHSTATASLKAGE